MFLLGLLTFLLIRLINAQNPSPCPGIFTYEPRGQENDRWYGVITLESEDELSGIWLHIQLDRQAELLGNWFGESTSPDNRDFTVMNTRYRLQANTPLTVRIFIKYNTALTIPSLISIRLNGKMICPSAPPSTETPPHISNVRPPVSGTNTSPGSALGFGQTGGNTGTNFGQTSGNNFGQGGTSRPGTGGTPNTGFNRPVGPQPNNNPVNRPGVGTSSRPTTLSSDEEFFPGDFSLPSPNRPNQNRPALVNSRPQYACGTVSMRARPLLTFGQQTSEGEYPWHAALYRSKGVDLQYTCGASLVSPSHIITAAHCVTRPKTSRPVNKELLLVYLGKHNLKKFGTNVQDIQISHITVHPEYNASFFQNDIAIVHLEHPAEITDYVRPVCIWEEDVNLNNVIERLGTVVGWGFDETGTLTENLMQAKMPIVSTETCIFSNPEFFSRFTSPTTFCAGFRNGTSACTGDSGGGMVFPKSGTSGQNSVWQLRGVVSLSAALQNERLVCDTSNYIVFTDIAKHRDWVSSVINGGDAQTLSYFNRRR